MSGPKVVLLVLALLLLLFVAALLLTERSNSPARRDNKELAKKPAPGWIKSFGSLFSPEPPKLKLQGSPFQFTDSLGTISIPPSSDEFRTATFVLRRGARVNIVYDDQTPGAGKDLEHQDLELPREVRDREDDPRRGTITVLKGGGKLNMACLGGPCEVILE